VLAGASSFAAIRDWLHDLDEQARNRLGFEHGEPVGTVPKMSSDALSSTVGRDGAELTDTRIRREPAEPKLTDMCGARSDGQNHSLKQGRRAAAAVPSR
jgi:hypothetical protein